MPGRDHEQLTAAADLVVLTVRDDRLQVLVIVRGKPPFAERSALPGGFLRAGEDMAAAARRELREETGLDAGRERLHLELLSVYSAPERDPRGRVLSVAYVTFLPDLPMPRAGSDARRAFWAPVEQVRGTLAFDHDQILDDAVERTRARLEHTTLATAFCAPEFTLADLRAVYEVVWGEALDPGNFTRKVKRTEGFVRPTDRKRAQAAGRPAALYVAGPARVLVPPLLRGGHRDSTSIPPGPVVSATSPGNGGPPDGRPAPTVPRMPRSAS